MFDLLLIATLFQTLSLLSRERIITMIFPFRHRYIFASTTEYEIHSGNSSDCEFILICSLSKLGFIHFHEKKYLKSKYQGNFYREIETDVLLHLSPVAITFSERIFFKMKLHNKQLDMSYIQIICERQSISIHGLASNVFPQKFYQSSISHVYTHFKISRCSDGIFRTQGAKADDKKKRKRS